MTDTETTDELEATADMTELSLRSWGLSGQPVTWAWTEWQPVVSMIRAANTGFGTAEMVQTSLDAVFPDAGYLAANVCLAHPPSAEFVIQEGTVDPEGPPYVAVMRVDLAADEDLDLPNEQVEWDFGDGGAVEHDAHGWEHGYVDAGVYTVRCTVPVAGVLYSTTQEFTAGEVPEADPQVAVEYAERPATVFDDPDNPPEELPYGNAVRTAEPVEEDSFDPGEHTVQEVKDYLAEHPDELDAVLEAELAGKARTTILDL